MIEIKINNSEQVTAWLNKIAEHTEHRKPLMKSIAGTMKSAVLQNFDESGRPKWLGLKYRTGMPLINGGNLRKSIGEYYDNDQAIVGTNVEYAAIHQFGGMAGRNKKVEIPARPFLTLTEQDEADILEDIQDYFRNLVK